MFRFTIRDLLWLMLVVSITLGLWLGWSREVANLKRQQIKQKHECAKQFKGLFREFQRLEVKAKKPVAQFENLKSSEPDQP